MVFDTPAAKKSQKKTLQKRNESTQIGFRLPRPSHEQIRTLPEAGDPG
jgi:hypothetical protein